MLVKTQRTADAHLGNVVGRREAAGKPGRRDHRAGIGRVGAEIGHRLDLERLKLSLVVERQCCLAVLVARLMVAEKRLRPRRHPVHRAPDLARRDEKRRIFGIGRRLQAEGAADIVGEHPQFFRRDAHDRRQTVGEHAGALARTMKRVPVLRRVIDRRRAARLQRHAGEPLVDGDVGDLVGRRGDDRVDLGEFCAVARHDEIDGEVRCRVRPDLRRALGEGGARIGDRRLRIVVDFDLFGRIGGDRRGFRDDQCHRVADMHDAASGQRRPFRHHRLLAVAPDDRDRA